jgi:hypothetical protein
MHLPASPLTRSDTFPRWRFDLDLRQFLAEAHDLLVGPGALPVLEADLMRDRAGKKALASPRIVAWRSSNAQLPDLCERAHRL